MNATLSTPQPCAKQASFRGIFLLLKRPVNWILHTARTPLLPKILRILMRTVFLRGIANLTNQDETLSSSSGSADFGRCRFIQSSRSYV